MSALTRDADPVARLQEVWFEPGESLKVDVPEVGTLTLKGEWLDHVPIWDCSIQVRVNFDLAVRCC